MSSEEKLPRFDFDDVVECPECHRTTIYDRHTNDYIHAEQPTRTCDFHTTITAAQLEALWEQCWPIVHVEPFLKKFVRTVEEAPMAKPFTHHSSERFTTGELMLLMALNQQFGHLMFGHDHFIRLAGRLKGAIDKVGREG